MYRASTTSWTSSSRTMSRSAASASGFVSRVTGMWRNGTP